MRWLLELLLAAGVGALGTYAVLKKPRRRQRRHEHFLSQTTGTTMGISHDLLWTVHLLLQQALNERRKQVWRSAKNHSAHFAPTVVIVVATALDAWLSELIAFARSPMKLSTEQIAGVIDIGTVPEKYERTTALLLGERLRPSTDLRMLSKLRNEIVHFLPYAQNVTAQTVPEWLRYLEQKQLLILGNRHGNFHFSQKLSSYALAYWACETAHDAAARLAAQAQQHQHLSFFVKAENFRVTAGIHSPEELHHFDTQHSLTLT